MKLKIKGINILLCLSMMGAVLAGIGPFKDFTTVALAAETIDENSFNGGYVCQCEICGSICNCYIQRYEPVNGDWMSKIANNDEEHMYFNIPYLDSDDVKGSIMLPEALPMTEVEPWALGNLILSVAGVILVLMIMLHIPMKKREYPEYDEGNQSRSPLILAISVQAIVGIILFILTQDMSRHMLIINNWTLTHVILLSSGILCYIIISKKDKELSE